MNQIIMEDDTLSLKELLSIDLTKVPEQESLQILDNNFPCCYIIRIGDSLEITLEEHIYTKYWFHKVTTKKWNAEEYGNGFDLQGFH